MGVLGRVELTVRWYTGSPRYYDNTTLPNWRILVTAFAKSFALLYGAALVQQQCSYWVWRTFITAVHLSNLWLVLHQPRCTP